MGPQRGAEVSVPLVQFAACRVVKIPIHGL